MATITVLAVAFALFAVACDAKTISNKLGRTDVLSSVYCTTAAENAVSAVEVLQRRNNNTASPYRCTMGQWTATQWTAKANYSQQINQTGWNGMFVESNPAYPDLLTAYSAGYVEGAITTSDTYLVWVTLLLSPSQKVQQFINQQYDWMLNQIDNNPTDPYWQQVSFVLAQLRGLTDGYNAVADYTEQLTFDQIMWLGMTVELGDIEKKVKPETRPDFSTMTHKQLKDYVRNTSHCSVLVKTLPDLSDIYFAHDTWSSYANMLRHFKTYKLPFTTGNTAATTVLLSGYPATLASIDDFYLNSQQIAITETTNDIFNASLYDLLTIESVPYWVRSVVASRQAKTAAGWHDVFYQYNSGTYSNQWITLDYKLFYPGQPLVSNTLWVSEQLPGYYQAADVTTTLQFGHWPSYNVPYFQDIYEMSGYPAVVKKYGLDYSYQMCPRAQIFRRDANKVADLASMKQFMLENNYGRSDPLATDPGSAISSRWDLYPASEQFAGGGIDSKIVNLALVQQLQVLAKSGPTFQNQPLFSWTGEFANQTLWPHYGQPTSFNFDFVLFN